MLRGVRVFCGGIVEIKRPFVLLCALMALSSFGNDEPPKPPVDDKPPLVDDKPPARVVPANMDRSFAELERGGMDAHSFIELLHSPEWSTHPRIFSWVAALLRRKDSAIDDLLVGLLSQKTWFETSNGGEVTDWVSTLIERKFADNGDVAAMLGHKPWKRHMSIIARRTHLYMSMVGDGMPLKEAVGRGVGEFLLGEKFDELSLAENPRLFTWVRTILENWGGGFELAIAARFRNVDYWETSRHWVRFADFDRVTEILLTEETAPLSERIELLRHLPRNDGDQRMLGWIQTAVERNGKNYNHRVAEYLAYLLNQALPNALEQSESYVEVALLTVDLLLGQGRNNYWLPEDTNVADVVTVLAKKFGPDDPRIIERMDQILYRSNLPFYKVVQLLRDPLWRERPEASELMVKLAVKPLYTGFSDGLYPFHQQWVLSEVEALLAEPYWHKHHDLRKRVGKLMGIGPYRRVSIKHILHRSCRSLVDRVTVNRELKRL